MKCPKCNRGDITQVIVIIGKSRTALCQNRVCQYRLELSPEQPDPPDVGAFQFNLNWTAEDYEALRRMNEELRSVARPMWHAQWVPDPFYYYDPARDTKEKLEGILEDLKRQMREIEWRNINRGRP